MFRATTKEGKVVKGYYAADKEGKHHYIVMMSGPDGTMPLYSMNEIIPSTLAQKTGIKDKNDTPIYGSFPVDGKMSKGGDEVRYMDGKIMEVFYSTDGYAGWKLRRKPNHGKGLLIYGLYNHRDGSGAVEVIGKEKR